MKKMLISLAALALLGGGWQDDAVQGTQDAIDTIADAAKKVTSDTNYSFKGKVLTEMPSFGGGGDREPEPSKFEGRFDPNIGSIMLTATTETVTYKGKTATRPRSEWRVVEEDGEGGRGGRRGGRFGRRGGMFGGGGQMNFPHQDLNKLGKKLKKAEKTRKTENVGKTECSVYEAEFTSRGAEDLWGNNRMLDSLEDAEFTGEAKLWIDEDGALLKYEITASFAGYFREREFEMTQTRTVKIYNVGKTKVKIPAGAKAAIEGKNY